jgi:hypothetical protein
MYTITSSKSLQAIKSGRWKAKKPYIEILFFLQTTMPFFFITPPSKSNLSFKKYISIQSLVLKPPLYKGRLGRALDIIAETSHPLVKERIHTLS